MDSDQPQAIAKLTAGLVAGAQHQVRLGVTGSGGLSSTNRNEGCLASRAGSYCGHEHDD
jgi:hypothetical protein